MRFVTCMAFLIAFFVSTPSSADDVYEMEKVCTTEDQLWITKVTNTDDKTIIDLEFRAKKNFGSGRNGIGLYPAGHQKAFYIQDLGKAQKYHLLESEGISIRPNGTPVNKGGVIKFRLIFERIPMRRFHMIEGVTEFERGTPWYFTNIKLK